MIATTTAASGFTKNQRSGHRDQCDCVDAEAADPEIAQDRNSQRDYNGQRRGRPNHLWLQGANAGPQDNDPGDQTQQGDRQERPSQD